MGNRATQAALHTFPGLRPSYAALCAEQLAQRPALERLSARAAAAERAVQAALRGETGPGLNVQPSDVAPLWLWLTLPAPIVVSGNYDYASGGRGLRKVIDRLGRVPDAVICGNDIMAIGEGVRKKFEEILVPAGMGDVSIFTEMGRFTTGPYGALVATAIHEKHIYKEYIGLDACAANLMRPAMYGAYHHITVLGKENAPCDHKYDVVGGLCENNDKFAIDRMLPKIDIGDLIYIHDTGAHGSAMGYNYNGKLRSAEVLLCEDGSHRLIRRAETPRDYFATLDFLPAMKPLFEGYDD